MRSDKETLESLDRPEVDHWCESWGRNVPLRRLAAADTLYFASDYVAMLEGESEESQVLRFYAEMLSRCVSNPKCSADAWMDGVRLETLTDLGIAAMRINDMVPPEDVEDAKKNEAEPGTDSYSS